MSIELTNLICPLMYDKQISSETKGGYIQGSIILPNVENSSEQKLKLRLYCIPAKDEDLTKTQGYHPCIPHLIYFKESPIQDSKIVRDRENEPPVNFENRIREMEVVGKNVIDSITNKKVASVAVFGNEIQLGHGIEKLNIIIRRPKRENLMKEAQKFVSSDQIKTVEDVFMPKDGVNLKTFRLRVEMINEGFLYMRNSAVLKDSSFSVTLERPTIQKCCFKGGRTMLIHSKDNLNDILPKFQGYGVDTNVELIQPKPSEILRVNKNLIQFAVPPQDETVVQSLGKLTIGGKKKNPNSEFSCSNEFKFEYVSHPWPPGSKNCIFCEMDIDGRNCDDENEVFMENPDPDDIESIHCAQDVDAYEVVTVGQTSSARSSTVFEYFFNILDSGILPPLYSLEEFFGLKKIEDPDRSGILSQVSLTSDHQIPDVMRIISFPFFKRKSVDRGFADYFPNRLVEPSLIVLHKYQELSHLLWVLLGGGMSCHYIVIRNPRLILQLANPTEFIPQSVAKYNKISVTAFVQTDEDDNLDEDDFFHLINTVKHDLENFPFPKYLLSHKELRHSGWHGFISNMEILRKISGLKTPRDDNIFVDDLL